MKRHKAGKAGFTDKAHLKARTDPRSDGKKKKYQTSISREKNENF